MAKVYLKNRSISFTNEGNYQQNENGSWSTAIPLPFYGLKKKCDCGKSFWKEENYRTHYFNQHTDKRYYKRTPEGMVEL